MAVCKESWAEEAYAAIRWWARYVSPHWNGPATIEEVRVWMYRYTYLEQPPEERWIGPVVQRALREKIIRRKGFAPAKSSHGALKARYVGTRFA